MATWSSRFWLSLLAAAAALSQPAPLTGPPLSVNVQLEHDFYFPLEDVQVSITLRNDARVPVNVPLPFGAAEPVLCLGQHPPHPGFRWVPLSYWRKPISSDDIMTALRPGAEVKATLWLSESCRGCMAESCEAPPDPRDYSLYYAGGSAHLQVVEPMLEQWSIAGFATPFRRALMLSRPDGSTLVHRSSSVQAVRAAVLSYKGVRFVVVSQAVLTNGPEPLHGPVRYQGFFPTLIGRIRRIATTTEAIDELKVELTENGGAVVTFRESGIPRAFRLGPEWIRADRPEFDPGWLPLRPITSMAHRQVCPGPNIMADAR